MIITAIRRQGRAADRYSVYIDGRFCFGLSESGLLSLGLRSGQTLSAEELTNLKRRGREDKARYQAMTLLARRPRSQRELQTYLSRKGYEKNLIARTLSWLRQHHYADDRQFAAGWVANRRLLKAVSVRRLRQELRQKGVNASIIDEVLDQDETDERQVLRQLIQRKRRLPRYHDNVKLMQYLARQGFNYEDIKLAMNAAKEDSAL